MDQSLRMPLGIATVILLPMKTGVSIPDDDFYAVEELCQQLVLSRSELYARAIAAFPERQCATGVKMALDAIYALEDPCLDPEQGGLQALSLPQEEWGCFRGGTVALASRTDGHRPGGEGSGSGVILVANVANGIIWQAAPLRIFRTIFMG